MELRFPSKTFVVGEYSVLTAGRALLLGHPPFFRAIDEPAATLTHPFHAHSPAGRWLAGQAAPGRKITFTDPHQGKGGFGASGAEFLAAWFSAGVGLPSATEEERQETAWAAWDATRSAPGSGADLLTQAFLRQSTAAQLVALDIKQRRIEGLPLPFGVTFSLFHTGRKLPTHEHLRAQNDASYESLTALTDAALSAARSGNAAAFCAAVQAYGDELNALGLVADWTQSALASLPRGKRFLAAKGCGAMGADVLLVLHTGAPLQTWAEANLLAEIVRLPL